METASNFKHHIVVHSYKGKVGTTASILRDTKIVSLKILSSRIGGLFKAFSWVVDAAFQAW